MTKWEYLAVHHKHWQDTTRAILIDQEMNKMGDDGWELVGFAVVRSRTEYIFKRPKEDAPD